MSLSRRTFIAGAAGGALALAGGATALVRAGDDGGRSATAAGGAAAPSSSPADRILVLVTLYGGNDGLGVLAPVADGRYRDARADLAMDAAAAHPLTDGLALHPSLAKTKGLWDDGRLAIVRGVGSPTEDRSHFRTMDIWQTADPKDVVTSGWLGRWLDATGTDPFRALSTGPTLPRLLVGDKVSGTALPSGKAQTKLTGPQEDVYRLLMDPSAPGLAGRAGQVGTDLLAVEQRVGDARGQAGETGAGQAGTLDAGTPAADAGGALGGQLAVVGGLIKAGLPTKVYAASLGGFDTHAGQAATQERLLGELDAAVSGFFTSLDGHPAADRVVLVAYSEFGRRVHVNGSGGTDHGRAGVLLAAGRPVSGGFHGEQPPLDALDDGDLRVTTDFRAVYGSLLADVVGVDPGVSLAAGAPPALKLVR